MRSLAVAPAAIIGSTLWQRDVALPFLVAGIIGVIGAGPFAVTVDERYAG